MLKSSSVDVERMLISYIFIRNVYNKRVDKIKSGLIDHCQKSTQNFKRKEKTYIAQYTTHT